MKKEFIQPKKSLQQLDGEHILYYFNELESYIQNAVAYITSGIEQGDHILFLENDRISPILQKELKNLLTKEQLTNVHFMNNFDFYYRKGNFYPSTILSHFSQIADPYFEKNLSFRTWGHVEWGKQKEIERMLEEFERETSKMLHEIKVTTVCAYDANQVPEPLKKTLMKFHEFLMTDDDFTPLNK